MSKKDEVIISKAKGRPMLSWVGKRPLSKVRAYPTQLVETFNASAQPAVENPNAIIAVKIIDMLGEEAVITEQLK